ncbi:hypothetical protein BCR44DRAFT_1430228 [Catenaria anguillulae PL171]|uniref:N-acetylgalactosaminide beta-1,3-galactosyltransferase n=1 Tax=Catenaria anguillulae PL171 TaxID=765915 RepID=A0A1Y2HS76_9FUNG|nr:hypothetical protein BCR44DRAFT_1430228 [Catenaria anguillulae PL171]
MPSPLLEKRRIEDTQGWKDDAVKFLPAIGLLHRTFPDADWYIIADDDIYFFTENLHHTLSKFNPTDVHYMGIPTLFVGCDGVQKFGEGPAFAHGGSGILMSKAAVAKVLTVLDKCIVKYHTCWAGDITVALCMRDFRYPHNPCIRPITFHHLKPDVMEQVHLATQVARARLQDMEYVWDKVTHRTHAHLYHTPAGSTTPELVARTSPHYAPHTDPDDPIVHIDKMRNSDAYHEFVAGEGPKALAECRNKCIDDKKCRSWDFNPADRKCRLMEPVPRLEDRDGGITGIVKGRFTCSAYSM